MPVRSFSKEAATPKDVIAAHLERMETDHASLIAENNSLKAEVAALRDHITRQDVEQVGALDERDRIIAELRAKNEVWEQVHTTDNKDIAWLSHAVGHYRASAIQNLRALQAHVLFVDAEINKADRLAHKAGMKDVIASPDQIAQEREHAHLAEAASESAAAAAANGHNGEAEVIDFLPTFLRQGPAVGGAAREETLRPN